MAFTRHDRGFPSARPSRDRAIAAEPTTDFVGPGAGASRDLVPELRDILDRYEVLWDFDEWAAGHVAPVCWRSLVPARSAIDVWRRMRTLVDESRCWPLVVGGPDDEAAHLAALRESLDSTDGLIREGLALDVDEWLAEEAAIDPDLVRELGDELPIGSSSVITHRILDAPAWRLRRAGNGTLLWIETPHPWDVPAILRFGGWNSCPPAQVHVAMLRRWNQRWGTELVGISRDRLELAVTRRPRNRREALLLAREHFLYCEELVLAEHGSLAALASALLVSQVWSFRWD
jgi:hypothetical protein